MTYEEYIHTKIINKNIPNYELLLEAVLQTSVAPSVYLKDKLTKQKVSAGLHKMFGDILHKSKNTSINFYYLKEYRTNILGIDCLEVKTCVVCKEELLVSSFYSNGYQPTGGKKYKSTCKKCSTAKIKNRLEELILKVFSKYECSICKYSKCKQALEFHHINPSEKEFRVSEMGTITEDKVIKELEKCMLVCANCHREIHYGYYPQYIDNSFVWTNS